MTVNIGIDDKARGSVAGALVKVLADTYTLYLKTHNFHWNVTGPSFPQLHSQFETQYTEMAAAVDEIAERIRALGAFAPGGYAAFGKLTEVKEAAGVPAATDMIRQLLADNELLVRAAREALRVAEQAGDDESVDLMVRRMQVHGKNAWMLRAQVE
jgi:starvation-inducible DNA-binding protein